MSNKPKTTTIIFIVLIVALSIIIPCCIIQILSTNSGQSSIDCVEVDLTTCIIVSGDSARIGGSVTNNCSQTVQTVRLLMTGLDSDNNIGGTNADYFFDLSPMETDYFETIVLSPNARFVRCKVNIKEASYK